MNYLVCLLNLSNDQKQVLKSQLSSKTAEAAASATTAAESAAAASAATKAAAAVTAAMEAAAAVPVPEARAVA